MENSDISRIEKPSMSRRDMLTAAAAATILCGEGALSLGAQSKPTPPTPAAQDQRKAFFALWLLLSGRQDFFVIDTPGGIPSITCPQQEQISADLRAFFTSPATQMSTLLTSMKMTDKDTGVPYYQAFRAVRAFFHTLGTVSPPGAPTPPPYQPGEVCGKLAEIMAIGGVSNPQTKESGT